MPKESSEGKILELLDICMDHGQLEDATNLTHAGLFDNLKKLEAKEKIKKILFTKGSSRAGTSPEYFGRLASKTIYYKHGNEKSEESLLLLLNQEIPPKDEMRNGVQKALAHILKRRLPESIYEKFYATRRKKIFRLSEDHKKILDLLSERSHITSQEIAEETQIGNRYEVGRELKTLRYHGYVKRSFAGPPHAIIKWELIKNYKA
jgi:hypothetical protein